MDTDDQIIGFRQDRIGARLICMLNVMRLARKFDATGRFLWLSQPEGSYPELTDPHDFFAADFVSGQIRVVDKIPDLSQLTGVGTVAPSMNVRGFAERLAEGQRFDCNTMSETVRFMDETPAGIAAEMREVALGLKLAPPLEKALARARRAVARAGGGDAMAIHVRRGDILDGPPWCYTAWPSKFVPDEFFRAFISTGEGPVMAFSDTPEAVRHLAQGNPRVLPVTDLFAEADLPQPARDLLELVLMSECASVGAPSHSAFSRAAEVAGRCRIMALPGHLRDELRRNAYDALLDRVVGDRDSFFAPGDLAQSVCYAARHAVTTGRGAELVDALEGRDELLESFPFLYRELAVTAWAAGRLGKARALAERGLAAPNLQRRDKPQCRQVMLMADAGNKPQKNPEVDGQFLSMLFTGRTADGPIIPVLARKMMRHDTASVRALMFDRELMAPYSPNTPENPNEARILPLWMLRLDWSEFVTDKALLRELRNWPELWDKMKPAAAGLGEVEEKLALKEKPKAGAGAAIRYGFCASILRLHGRLNRSFALLGWLHERDPDRALTHKRMADTCFAAELDRGGWKWLELAMELAPENALLQLSAARRAGQTGDTDRAARHLDAAEALWPDLPLIKQLRRVLR